MRPTDVTFQGPWRLLVFKLTHYPRTAGHFQNRPPASQAGTCVGFTSKTLRELMIGTAREIKGQSEKRDDLLPHEWQVTADGAGVALVVSANNSNGGYRSGACRIGWTCPRLERLMRK